MKKYDVRLCKISTKTEIAPGFFDIRVEAGGLAEQAQPGQFAQIKVPGAALRRPISICEIDRAGGRLRFVFQIRGEGTRALAQIPQGEALDILAPLGTGFPLLEAGQKALLIGGGIGTPPLLPLAQHYGANSVAALGFRDASSVILWEDFAVAGAEVRIATDDGSAGRHGLVTQAVGDLTPDVLYACGPLPMLKAVARLADARQIPCYVSLEERMACGVGACLGCACTLLDEKGRPYQGSVCKNGPVFDYRRVAGLRGEERHG